MDSLRKPSAFFRETAFIIYPVKDTRASRTFYEQVLGLRVATQWNDDWIEYDIGAGTLAITKEDERHKAGAHGPSVAIEIDDLEGLLESLKAAGVSIHDGPWDSPACLGCIIRDPDGNELILHKKKEST